MWSAPLPDPQSLADYERLLPGAAERMLQAFESVTVDASARDDRIVDAEVWKHKVVTISTIAIVSCLVVMAFVLFWRENNWGGSALLAGPLALGLASIIRAMLLRVRRPGDGGAE